MIIKGYNIRAENFGHFVIWIIENPGMSNVHVFMRYCIDVFERPDWFIDQDFDNEEDGFNACISAITNNHKGEIQKISKVKQGVL